MNSLLGYIAHACKLLKSLSMCPNGLEQQKKARPLINTLLLPLKSTASYQNIIWLNVSMDDTSLFQKLQCKEQLLTVRSHSFVV